MKKGWEYKKLNSICLSIEDGDWIESKDQSQSGIRLIQTGNIGNGSFKDKPNSAKYISEETFKKLHCTEVFEGDILVSRLPDPVGRACILPDIGCRCITAVDCSILKIKEDLVYYEWITYYMQSQAYFTKIKNQCTGSTRQRITRKKLAEIQIPVPPLSEQQRIVDYLDAAFAKIDAMKANAEKALNEAKALFQASLKEMLEPKEGWEEKKFGKICNFVRGPFGGSLKKECFKDSGYPVYEQQNAIYNKFTFRYFIDEEKFKSLIRFKVNSGDLIMSCSGTIGKVAIIPEGAKDGIINQALLKLTPNKDVDAHFLKYLMESNYFKEIINANIEGVAIKNIASVAVLKEIKLYIPKVNEQQNIVLEIDSLKSKVDRLQENYAKMSQECDALKQAILRQIFE